MVLYAAFSAMASEGLIFFDAEAGTITLRVDDLMLLGTGAVGYIGTFAAGRYAKARGGAT
jgi:hypothetical protein